MCEKPNDKRLAGIPNNIVASDGRYHKDCKNDFFLSFDKTGKKQSEKDQFFINLFATFRSDRTWIWNVVELYNLHNPENEDFKSSRKNTPTLIKHLSNYFNDALVSFHARFYAELIYFKNCAGGVLKLAQMDLTEDSIEIVAGAMHDKRKDLITDAENYNTQISLDGFYFC